MTFYAKLIAAIVGLGVMAAKHYGLDLEPMTALLTDALIGTVTAVVVWRATNKPASPAQVAVAQDTIKEAKADIKAEAADKEPIP